MLPRGPGFHDHFVVARQLFLDHWMLWMKWREEQHSNNRTTNYITVMAYNSEFILIHCNTNMEKKYQNTPSDTCIESDCGTGRRGCIGLHMQTHRGNSGRMQQDTVKLPHLKLPKAATSAHHLLASAMYLHPAAWKPICVPWFVFDFWPWSTMSFILWIHLSIWQDL